METGRSLTMGRERRGRGSRLKMGKGSRGMTRRLTMVRERRGGGGGWSWGAKGMGRVRRPRI